MIDEQRLQRHPVSPTSLQQVMNHTTLQQAMSHINCSTPESLDVNILQPSQLFGCTCGLEGAAASLSPFTVPAIGYESHTLQQLMSHKHCSTPESLDANIAQPETEGALGAQGAMRNRKRGW